MERSVAIKKLQKILGKGFGYRVNPKAAMREERDKAKEELKSAVAKRDELKAKTDQIRETILAGNELYQEKKAAYEAAWRRCEELSGLQHSYRITVGNVNGVGGFKFFNVKAQGDNWEDVIAELKGA